MNSKPLPKNVLTADEQTSPDSDPLPELSAFQRDALVAIARLSSAGDEPPLGLDVKKFLEAQYGREVHHGQVYPNINTLVEKGIVERERRDSRSKWLHLTDEGGAAWQALQAWVCPNENGAGSPGSERDRR